MKQISSAEDIESLGTILSVWAHPDDETFTSAGIMHRAIKNGQKVICVTATKGEAGSQNEQKWPLSSLARVREAELEEALSVIGIDTHHWLGYKDGFCQTTDSKKALNKLVKLIIEHKPDTILTFGKDGITGHTDHCCVSCWVDDAVKSTNQKPTIYHAVHTKDQYQNYLKYMDDELDIFFNIDEPPILEVKDCDIYLELDDSLKRMKFRALSVMNSQTEIMLRRFDKKFIVDALSTEAFVLSR